MTKKIYRKKEGINKNAFIHLLANEAGFTLADTRVFWKAVEDIFERAVLTDTTLNIAGFGKLYITHVDVDENSNKRWDGINKKWIDPEPYKKVVFKLSGR